MEGIEALRCGKQNKKRGRKTLLELKLAIEKVRNQKNKLICS